MASEKHFLLTENQAHTIRDMLLDGIKAQLELKRAIENLEQAAKASWPAAHLLVDGLKPRCGDLDCYEAAEMALMMGLLDEVKEA